MTQHHSIARSISSKLNPKPRPGPRCYSNVGSHLATSDGARDALDDERTHEIFMIFLALFATLSFASLCAVIA